MKTIKLLLLMLMPVLVIAQERGIRFEQDLSWNQIKTKAKAEHKYIFVDCYATWCVPCKMMDRDVYPNDTVGALMNEKFISVKMQMDVSKDDNEAIKARYTDADNIRKDYHITAMPSFLFFDTNGNPVAKEAGSRNAKNFITMVKKGLDPSNQPYGQYYSLLQEYKHGTLPADQMRTLAKMAKENGEEEDDLKIARDYMLHSLDHLSDEQFLTKDNLNFINSRINMVKTTDGIFLLCLHEPAKLDTLMWKGFAEGFANLVISNEEISPVIEKAKASGAEPDWKMMNVSISKKFGKKYATGNILFQQYKWYKSKKDWTHYTEYLIESVDLFLKDHPDGNNQFMYLNNTAFDVFRYSLKKNELERALYWSDLSIQMAPQFAAVFIDTKANLLYKLGRKEEAIEWEEKALAADPKSEPVKSVLEKMKNGQPTW